MDPDDGEDPDCYRVKIPVDLIYEVTMAIVDSISEWHVENGNVVVEYKECVAVISSAASAAIEMMGRQPKNEWLQ